MWSAEERESSSGDEAAFLLSRGLGVPGREVRVDGSNHDFPVVTGVGVPGEERR